MDILRIFFALKSCYLCCTGGDTLSEEEEEKIQTQTCTLVIYLKVNKKKTFTQYFFVCVKKGELRVFYIVLFLSVLLIQLQQPVIFSFKQQVTKIQLTEPPPLGNLKSKSKVVHTRPAHTYFD